MISRISPPIDTGIERQIIKWMISSDEFCLSVEPFWKVDCFQFPHSKVIGTWCRSYFDVYGKAPKGHIKDIFLNNKGNLPPDNLEAVQTFLSGLNEEFEDPQTLNIKYISDIAEKYIRITSLQNLRSRLNDSIISGNPEDGENLISEYVRPSRPVSKGINPVTDLDSVLKVFREKESRSLIAFPGALGKILAPLNRGNLFAFVGPSGVGKTWWMIRFGLQAMFRGLNVAFFSYEMEEEEITERIQTCLTGLSNQDTEILIPVWDCYLNQVDDCRNSSRKNRIKLVNGMGVKPSFNESPERYSPCCVCRGGKDWFPETWFKKEKREIINEQAITLKNKVLVKQSRIGDFHLAAFPSGQMSVQDVRTYLKNREYYEGVMTDLVITDSADKMRTDNHSSEHRHGIYKIWMDHKALAGELHAGVVTASHSNTERTGKKIKQGDWAEDIRKLRESDIALALNQTALDKTSSRYSVNSMKVRGGKFNYEKGVTVLSCLDIGQPYMDSDFERNPPRKKDEK